jgi:hypothetical protein
MGIYPKETACRRDTCPMLVTAVFTIARIGVQPDAHQQVNKENVVDIHDYSAIKKHEILSFVTI